MKQLQTAYFEAVRAWDLKHRLIGKTSIQALCAESNLALATLPSDLIGKCLVDVGAGAGILGFPWLWRNPLNKVIFVEVDPKKAAFLAQFIGLHPDYKGRAFLEVSAIENVSRETIVKKAPEGFFLAARAFSGPKDLRTCLKGSSLSQDLPFVFTIESENEKKDRPVMRRLDL